MQPPTRCLALAFLFGPSTTTPSDCPTKVRDSHGRDVCATLAFAEFLTCVDHVGVQEVSDIPTEQRSGGCSASGGYAGARGGVDVHAEETKVRTSVTKYYQGNGKDSAMNTCEDKYRMDVGLPPLRRDLADAPKHDCYATGSAEDCTQRAHNLSCAAREGTCAELCQWAADCLLRHAQLAVEQSAACDADDASIVCGKAKVQLAEHRATPFAHVDVTLASGKSVDAARYASCEEIAGSCF